MTTFIGGAKRRYYVGEHPTLGTEHLIEILSWVIRKHGNISDSCSYSPELGTFTRADNLDGLELRVDTEVMEQLAYNLRVMTLVNVSNDVAALAQLMANIAIFVRHWGQVVRDDPGELEQPSPLTQDICREFPTACAVAFARSCGFPIVDVPHEHIFAALRVTELNQLDRIRAELTGIFEKALNTARLETSGQDPEDMLEESADAMIQYLERKFAEASPIPAPRSGSGVRQLSPESYWNLRSAAAQERWRSRDILALIEEYLRPELDPYVLHYGNVVSGDDWRSLYNWIHQDHGSMLWTDKLVSSQLS